MQSVRFFVLCFFSQFLVNQSMDAQLTEQQNFKYKTSDYGRKTITTIHFNEQNNPARYEANLNLPVCDDNLCANVIVKVYWDLAGNYNGFDTLRGIPLTKFDHRPFTAADYYKLDEILADTYYETNSLLIFDVINKSSPLIRSFIINKMPLPFSKKANNKAFAALYAELDSYSKSIFRQRMTGSKAVTKIFAPLIEKGDK